MKPGSVRTVLSSILAPILVCLIVSAVGLMTRAGYNWDNLFYVGIAEMDRGSTVEQAHRSAFAQARAALAASDYQKVVTNESADDPLRSLVAEDVEAYRQQLPFYSVKPVYPLLIAAFRAMGFNGVVASFWISAVALGLMAGLCCYWLSLHYAPVPAAILALLMAFSEAVFNLGIDPRPDALYAAVVVGTVMVAVRSQRLSWTLIPMLLLSILVRPDAIILCLLLSVAWIVIRPDQWGRPVVAAVLGLGLYLGLTKLMGTYSWPTLMHHCCVKYLPYPSSQPMTAGYAELIRIYIKFGNPTRGQPFYSMLLVAVAALIAALAVFPPRSPLVALGAVVTATLPLHFLVHPTDNLRVRSAYYVVSLMVLLISLSKAATGASPLLRRWLLAAPPEGT